MLATHQCDRLFNMRNLLYLLFILGSACTPTENKQPRKISPAFYHWKTAFDPTSQEINKLDSLGVNTIYLRLFDVSWNKNTQAPIPISKIIINDQVLFEKYNMIPTIFITDECIFYLKKSQIKQLAENMIQQIHISFAEKNISQLQIDCDWTKNSKDNYFQLLKAIKELAPTTILSATIRLHQIKFSATTGVPPVDRGMLMCYNMGNLRSTTTKNSILDVMETEKYLGNLSNYPLQLDIALPLFSWAVLFRDDKFKGLMQNNLEDYHNFLLNDGSKIASVKKDTVINGISFFKNDKIRFEESEPTGILKLARMVRKKLKTDSIALSFYHLDSITLIKYNTYELENIRHNLQ